MRERLRQGRVVRVATTGLSQMFGFGLSMALLAVVSLLAIPAMVAASGPRAWASIATGQAVGAVAAVVIAYGWVVTGPARIARGDSSNRPVEYAESLSARAIICAPVAAAACGIAALVVRDHIGLAVLGALSAASIGMTASWYFVGLSKPYLLLALETAPRVAGTLVGIALMRQGWDAAAGLWGQLSGILLGVVLCSTWILGSRLARGSWRSRRPTARVLHEQRHGVLSSAVSSLYSALPIVIVGLVALPAQPAFAVLDKLQRQISAAISPFVTVLQGWVPRGRGLALVTRVRVALVVTVVAGLALAAGLLLVGPVLVTWLGNGQIRVPFGAIALMAAVLAVGLVESVAARACLVAAGRMDYMARVTAVGAVIGLAMVVVLASQWGTVGALWGVLAGLVLRVALLLFGLRGLNDFEPAPVVLTDAEGMRQL
ncbi:MAG: hypothetical protein JJE50_06830 [Actinomycetales bacterium]|nr:hypothetical protein [Actinomycetales bacterium]